MRLPQPSSTCHDKKKEAQRRTQYARDVDESVMSVDAFVTLNVQSRQRIDGTQWLL